MELLRKLLESFVTRSAAERLKTPCLDGWLEATKGASAAVDKLESHLEVSATTAAGASAPASPLSGKAARGADGPPTRPALLTPVVAKSEKCVRS